DSTTIGAGAVSWLTANGYPVARRFADADPVALAASLTDDEIGLGARADTLALLNRTTFQDALSAGASMDSVHTVSLLVDDDSLGAAPATARWLGQHKGRLQRTWL